MAWNEPGGNRDPWSSGGRRGSEGPPDLDELLKKLKARFGAKGPTPPGLSSGGAGLILGAIALLWTVSGFYVVDEQERAVVLRFGAYARTSDPGLRWRIPWPVERHEKVNVTQVRQVTDRADMLTQDENIVDVELKVQYRVSSVENFLFNVEDPDGTLRQATKSAVREVVGRNSMDFILTDGRQQVANETKLLLQERLDDYKSGLIVSEVNLQQAQPPEPVQGAFADAIKAREDQQRLKNEAEAYANDRLPKARGAAARQTAEAIGYRDRVIAQAEGESARFTQLLSEYRKSPKVMRERLYLDAMGDVLSNTSKILVDVEKSNPMLYLPLDQLLRQPTTPAGGGTDSSAPSASGVPRSSGGSDYRSRERGGR
ncbi:MAG: FtsH protease activity modulator HflK [Gammaproteobacteria bacterium]|nr:FtsH protease activity modulator HflK [Gammaproteobacteria bacterium]